MNEPLASFVLIGGGTALAFIWLFFALRRLNRQEKARPFVLKLQVEPAPSPPPASAEPSMMLAFYYLGALVVGGLVFVGAWIYCIATYGFLFGVGLGWLPSAIVAVIAGFTWPLLVALVTLAVLGMMQGW